MRDVIFCFASATCLAGCAASEAGAPAHALAAATAAQDAGQEAPLESLDGLVAPGAIRARGVLGLVSVRGTLSFEDGMLVWTAQGSRDAGPYSLSDTDGAVAFSAEHVVENDERVAWSGFSDGRGVTDVTAVWTRVKGDFVHDLLLPDEVTLEFTPDG